MAFAVRLAPSTWGLALAEPAAFFPALTFFAAVISFAAMTLFVAVTLFAAATFLVAVTFLAAGAFFAAVAPFVTATFFPADTLLATAAPLATTALLAERDRAAFFAAAFFGDADAFFAPRARAAGGCPIRARAAGLVVRAWVAGRDATGFVTASRSVRPATLPMAFLVLATAFEARTTIERRGDAGAALFAPTCTGGFVFLWGMVVRRTSPNEGLRLPDRRDHRARCGVNDSRARSSGRRDGSRPLTRRGRARVGPG